MNQTATLNQHKHCWHWAGEADAAGILFIWSCCGCSLLVVSADWLESEEEEEEEEVQVVGITWL